MNFPSTTFFTAIGWVTLFLCGCEKPELKTADEPAVEEVRDAAPPKIVEPVMPEAAIVEDVAPVEKEEPPAESTTEISGPMQPMLVVKKADGKIVIEGIIKSPSHKDRIREELVEAFPEIEVVDNMIVNYDCDAVGWTGRIGQQLLIPYLGEVKDPYVDWIEGVITLKGSVESNSAQRDLTVMAIDAFTGTFTKDLNNQLTVAKE